jgi:rod shape-determining protein MreD
MIIDILTRLFVFVLLVLTQALMMNRIQLFDCGMPLLYVYFVLMFPRNYPKWAILLWCFALGIAVDMFTNTPGVAAFSLVLIGAIQPYMLELFVPRDADENMACSAKAMGWMNYLMLTLFLVVIYCIVFFSLETFSFFHWLHWLECVGASSLLTVLLIMTLENIRK